jgi:uncharacterized membrane protein YvbJ
MKYCANCGTENQENARFCKGCGQSLPSSSGKAPPMAEHSYQAPPSPQESQKEPGPLGQLAVATGSTVLAWIIIAVGLPVVGFLLLGCCAFVLIMIGGLMGG